MTVDHTVAGRRDVQFDSVRRIGRYPCLRHDKNVKTVVDDSVVDHGRLLSG